MSRKKFWNWKNQSKDEKTPEERILEIYGTIAEDSWFDDDVTPQLFKDELFSGSGPVTVYISSPGGDCIAASQIYTMLMDYKDNVTVKIDGVAASAASVIAMAGTRVLISPTAMMMIHNPATGAFGDHKDMEKVIEMLDEVKQSIITAYEIKTGLDPKELSKMMDSITWMSAKKAVEIDLFEILDGTEELLNKHGKRSMDFSAHDGLIEGLPYNLTFIVRTLNEESGEEDPDDMDFGAFTEEQEEKFIAETATEVLSGLTDEDRAYMKEHTDVYEYHFSLGMYIRNMYIYGRHIPGVFTFDADGLSIRILEKIVEMICADDCREGT